MSDKDDDLSPALQHRGPREQKGNSVTHSKDAEDAQHAHKLLNRVKNQDREVGRKEEVRRDGSKKPSEGGGRPQSAMSLAKNKKQAFSEILCEHNRRRPRSAAGQLKSMLMCPLNTVLSLLHCLFQSMCIGTDACIGSDMLAALQLLVYEALSY